MITSQLAAAQGYVATRPATRPDPSGQAGTFAKEMASGMAATLRASEGQAMAAMTGAGDPHALVQALAQTELAVETAVTIRDKVVEAYQEILRMPV